jgi:hypothetical protein
MSFSVASRFTCSPRASSASATSASSPIEGAPRCCHGVSPLSTPLHRKTNRKCRPLLQCRRCGAVPNAADRWPSSNDSPRHNSNSVLRRYRPRLDELAHPHTAALARSRASPRSVSPSHPDIFCLSPPTLTSVIASSSRRCAGSSSTDLDNSRELLRPLLAPFNLHRSRVRRPSGFLLTAFSNATLTPSLTLEHHSGVASEKALALFAWQRLRCHCDAGSRTPLFAGDLDAGHIPGAHRAGVVRDRADFLDWLGADGHVVGLPGDQIRVECKPEIGQ